MSDNFELDKVIHQPVRTKIMAYLINMGATDYTTIKQALSLSDGHMSTHMKELTSKKYIAMKKAFVDNKPKTTYNITILGKERFAQYLTQLKNILSM